ncbi:hypothetical protein XENOCAPTIV_029745, partial [Xenoophorus captivus]
TLGILKAVVEWEADWSHETMRWDALFLAYIVSLPHHPSFLLTSFRPRVDVVEHEDEGDWVRFSPLLTAAEATRAGAYDVVHNDLKTGLQRGDPPPCPLSHIHRGTQLAWSGSSPVRRFGPLGGLFHLVDSSSTIQGAVACPEDGVAGPVVIQGFWYESQAEGIDESRREQELKKINKALLTKLQELDTDIFFSSGGFFIHICAPFYFIHTEPSVSLSLSCRPMTGPEFVTEENCIFVGMVTDDVDVSELVDTISTLGRDIEESGRVTALFIQ